MTSCRLCGSASTAYAGAATGRKSGRRFELRRCSSCGFAFVAEPQTNGVIERFFRTFKAGLS
jgi:hypothetical protein